MCYEYYNWSRSKFYSFTKQIGGKIYSLQCKRFGEILQIYKPSGKILLFFNFFRYKRLGLDQRWSEGPGRKMGPHIMSINRVRAGIFHLQENRARPVLLILRVGSGPDLLISQRTLPGPGLILSQRTGSVPALVLL